LKRDLIWLSGLAAGAFAILAGLGIWQLQRLEWKLDLITRLEERIKAEPVTLAEAGRRQKSGHDIEYLRVRLAGRFLNSKERHLYSVEDGKAGWRIITPLELASGRIVMVDRGFVPQELKDPASRLGGLAKDPSQLTGIVRLPAEPGLFTPENDPNKNVWYWRDLQGMASSVLAADQVKQLVPFLLQVESGTGAEGWPQPGISNINLPNKHLQYAMTWFGLAGVLVFVFAFYLRGRLQQRTFT
jgi:surfeit locus 1 family protein